MLTELISSCFLLSFANGDNFPSLLSTNATIAIIIDREYLAAEYHTIKASIEEYMVYVKRDVLKNGGINVQYFSWTTISIKRDFSAILSIASCVDTWKLFRAAEKANLLHMAISESDCPRLPQDQAITVPIIKSGEEISQILLDLRTTNTYKWKSVVVLYDETLSRDQVTQVIRALSTENSNLKTNAAAVSLLKLTTSDQATLKSSLYSTLASISLKTVGQNFLAIVSHRLLSTLMPAAKALNLVTTKSQWLYLLPDTAPTIDTAPLARWLSEGDNVAFMHNATRRNASCAAADCHARATLRAFGAALDAATLYERDTARQVSDEEWEAIRPSKAERRAALLASARGLLQVGSACGGCGAWRASAGDTWGREFEPGGGGAVVEPVGEWGARDGPVFQSPLFPHVAYGFRGRHLPMVSYHNPPWQVLSVNASGAVVEFGGLVFDVVGELARSLNFTFSVRVVEGGNVTGGGEIVDLVTNFIPEAIVEMVRNKSVVLGAGAFTVNEEGGRFVNFTRALSTESYTFLVARPRELSRALLFMSPFTGDTWLCLSAAIVSMGPILYYIHRYSPIYEYRGIAKKGGLSSIENCIWYMYGALLQQGGMHLPQADSARIIVGAWWLVVLVVATTYCGNLVAFLTFPKIDIPITTIEELLAHRETVTWSMTKGSFLETQLRATPDTIYQQLYNGRIQVPKNKRRLVESIEDGKHVFIDWKLRLQYIMKKQYLTTDRCDLSLGQDEFFDEQLAMIVAQDTPYLEIINDEIKKLHQVGLIQKWLKNYLPKRDRCWKNNKHTIEVNNHTVNMDDMQGSFFVLLLGFVLSFLIIIVEKFWSKYASKRRKKIIQPFTT